MTTPAVLYIEDNPDNLLLIQRVMGARGLAFHAAETGRKGLEMAEELQPDIILLDINLPDIDGYEVARTLRAHEDPHLRTVPVIAVTANALRGDAEKTLEAGCTFYIAKPVNIRELWGKIASLLPETG